MGNGLVSQDYVENIFSTVIYLYIKKILLRMRDFSRESLLKVFLRANLKYKLVIIIYPKKGFLNF